MISIITPTYNRKKEIERLYKSILKNKITNLEWIIVDDGSNDGTDDLIKTFIDEKEINIKYFYQENSGKMKAINNAIKNVSNPYIFEIDSDDFLIDGFLEKVLLDIKIFERKDIGYAIGYLKNVGNEIYNFDKNLNKYFLENDNNPVKMFNLYNKYLYSGELLLLFKTDIRKKYEYELEDGERFITEAYLYNILDKNYGGIYLKNEISLICNYLSDGYTKNINKVFLENPKGYLKYYNSCLNMDLNGINKKRIFSMIKNYLLFGYILRKNIFDLLKGKKFYIKFLITLLYIPGYIKYKLRF